MAKVENFYNILYKDSATRSFLKRNDGFKGRELSELTISELAELVTYVAPGKSLKTIADNPFAAELWQRSGRKEDLRDIPVKERRVVWDKQMKASFGIIFG